MLCKQVKVTNIFIFRVEEYAKQAELICSMFPQSFSKLYVTAQYHTQKTVLFKDLKLMWTTFNYFTLLVQYLTEAEQASITI